MSPLLSICIPTYNRSKLLLDLLRELDRPGFLDFPFEVIVIDNASTDTGYGDIACYSAWQFDYRYFRRPTNVGLLLNHVGVFRKALGEFCLCLSDDDRLIPGGVAKAIAELQADSQIVAYLANWDEIDLVDHRISRRPAYNDVVYSRDRPAEAVRFFADVAFLPELPVYRTDAVARALFPSDVNFWALALMERLLRLGSIRSASTPYYLFVSRHEPDETLRATGGRVLPLHAWNSMSAGIEMLDARLVQAQQGERLLPVASSRVNFTEMAFMSAVETESYLTAFDVALALPGRYGPLSHGQVNAICLMAGFCALGQAAALVPGVASILLYQVQHLMGGQLPALVEKCVSGTGLTLRPYAADVDNGGATAVVLAATEAQRRLLIAGGWPAGQVFSLENLSLIFSL
jgi:hypothetical protein